MSGLMVLITPVLGGRNMSILAWGEGRLGWLVAGYKEGVTGHLV